MARLLPILAFLITASSFAQSDHSVARKWNEALLGAIRKDFARPTVHARNLFHLSMGMYDAWAVYQPNTSTYFLNHSFRNFYCPFEGIGPVNDKVAAQEEAISYTAYRILRHRFNNSPGRGDSYLIFDQLMDVLGYDKDFESTDYSTGSPAALGNYIASKIILFGLNDQSNEVDNYASKFYKPVNLPNPPYQCFIKLTDPNHWQPLQFITFIDQSGQIADNTPKFIGPEWGKVVPFSLQESELVKRSRDGYEYWIYHDPGTPPLLGNNAVLAEQYKWTFSLVAIWSSQLSAQDPTLWDISPASMGNITSYPEPGEDIRSFYNLFEGGDHSQGYEINPLTNQPYTPQPVKRGDYTRVLAEFWADGPNSETPPGHWFTILNYVNDHPLIEKRFHGEGPVLTNLEWDIKAYLVLGGAMHDAAVTAWGIKGYYDFIRPISAIRYMASLGQSSDPALPYYHQNGIPLVPGYIEIIKEDDPLASTFEYSVTKIKIKAWKGPQTIRSPNTDQAGVDWVVACNWWPYQRPTFVTPPFAGYISGHSTFSRTAAEVLSLLTGSEYFPGGMGEFHANKNEFLVFEEGPSEDIILQWAKYKDASDQCSLSRIWGGIHPPADDIPGRLIGMKLGPEAFHHAVKYFTGSVAQEEIGEATTAVAFPNPVHAEESVLIQFNGIVNSVSVKLADANGSLLYQRDYTTSDNVVQIPVATLSPGIYLATVQTNKGRFSKKIVKY